MKGQRYEFDDEENMIILRVAKRMNWAGIASIIYGIINLLSYLSAYLILDEIDWSDMAYEILVTSIYVTIGLITLTVGKYFKLIHGTDGEDIQHLLEAFISLAKLKTVQVVLFSLIIIYMLADKVPFVIKILSAPTVPDLEPSF